MTTKTTTHPWKTIALASLAACSLALNARADILALENFGTHTGGTDVAGNGDGSGWSGTWTGDGNFNYQSSPVNFAGSSNVLSPSGSSYASNNAGDSGRVRRLLDIGGSGTFGLAGYINGASNIGADGTTLYIGWAMAVNPYADYFAIEMHRDGDGDGERHLEVSTDGPASPDLQLRLHNGGGPIVTIADDAVVGTGVNYFVLKISFLSGNDSVDIFMNPTLNAVEGTPTASISNAGDLSFDRMGFASFGANPSLSVDDIGFGSTYADVVGVVPEPSTCALLGVGLGAALFHRKRRIV